MVILTRQGKEAALLHIVTVLFSADADVDIAKAFKQDKLIDPLNLVGTSTRALSELYFINEDGDQEVLSKSQSGMLHSFKWFCHKLAAETGMQLPGLDWVNIAPEEFNAFRISRENDPSLAPTQTAPQSGTAPDRVSEFRRQSKRDVRLFPKFEDLSLIHI